MGEKDLGTIAFDLSATGARLLRFKLVGLGVAVDQCQPRRDCQESVQRDDTKKRVRKKGNNILGLGDFR